MQIPVSEIWADQRNNKSREPFTPESCDSLAQAIQEVGQLQPIGVVPVDHPEYKYRLVFGYRRYTAVATILQWDTINADVMEDTTPELADIKNAMENIEREDLTFYEECLALKNLFPAETSQMDIVRQLKKSRTWVRIRWLMWELPVEVIAQVRAGLLVAADISMLIQQSPEEQIAAAEKIKRGRAAGESARSMERKLTDRRIVRNKKDLQRMMTVLLKYGLEKEMHVLRFATSEINETQLREYLGIPYEPSDTDSGSGPGDDGTEPADGSSS